MRTEKSRAEKVPGSHAKTDAEKQQAELILNDDQDTYDNPLDGDPADPANDCNIPRQPARVVGGNNLPAVDAATSNLMSGTLQDFARLLSIRDATQTGSVVIALDPSVSGNYLNYLQNQTTYPNFDQTDRGQPYSPGYFYVTICANNMDFDRTYNYTPAPAGVDPTTLNFPTPCLVPYRYNNTSFPYTDSPGQPTERVRDVVTFRHPLITPFVSSLWPTIRLEASREGIVESFRKPRDVIAVSSTLPLRILVELWHRCALTLDQPPVPGTLAGWRFVPDLFDSLSLGTFLLRVSPAGSFASGRNKYQSSRNVAGGSDFLWCARLAPSQAERVLGLSC